MILSYFYAWDIRCEISKKNLQESIICCPLGNNMVYVRQPRENDSRRSYIRASERIALRYFVNVHVKFTFSGRISLNNAGIGVVLFHLS